MTWTPTLSDVNWTKNLIDNLNDHGVWAAPAAGFVVQVNKERKELKVLEHGWDPETLRRTQKVFEVLGWKV